MHHGLDLLARGLTLVASAAVVTCTTGLEAKVSSEECNEASVNLLQGRWLLEADVLPANQRSIEAGGSEWKPLFYEGLGMMLQEGSIGSGRNATPVELKGNAMAQINTFDHEPFMRGFRPGSDAVEVQFDLALPPEVSMEHPLFCNSFHKTGTNVCEGFLKARQGETGEEYYQCWLSNCTKNVSSGASSSGGAIYQQMITFDLLPLFGDGPFRMLNFIREPHSIILSAFRYHMQSPEEWWEGRPETCMTCGKADHDAMFGLCAETCNYLQLLTSVAAVNESAGVIVETLNERGNLDNMFNMTFAYANDPRVLHLSVGHLKKDFNSTMQCINTFLGGKGLREDQLHIFQSFNAESESAQFVDDSHITTGKYDNTFLEQFLLSHRMWGPQFATASAYLRSLFQRQAQAYGCPMP